ncbi:MAG: carboxyl transferase domain-containing protein [Microthrixaceae bacterium]
MQAVTGTAPKAVEHGDGAEYPASPLEELRRRREAALQMGGPEGVAKHHASGRLTVRERIDRLIDEGSLFEVGLLAEPELRRDKPIPGDAVVTGYAKLHGRDIALIGIDSSVMAGTTAPISMRKQGRLIAAAQRVGLPIVLLCDADGGRIPDVMGWRFSGLPLDFKTFLEPQDGSPHVPRAAALLGPSYGDSALHASTAHFAVMVEFGSVALSGPSVVGKAIGEDVSDDALGGPAMAQAAGNVHMVVEAEDDALAAVAGFLSYLPPSEAHAAPVAPARAPEIDPATLGDIVPDDPRRGYDMRQVIAGIVDGGSMFPWGEGWGPSLLTFLARIDGRSVGVIANQPIVGAGALDPPALRKERMFVDICDTFNLPLVFLQDVPGLLVGTDAERGGILHAYENLVTRIAKSTVPKIAIVIRKAYGGGHFAMGGRPTAPDFLAAWPTADMSFMAADTGVVTINRRRLERAMAEGGQEAYDECLISLEQEWANESTPWESAAHFHLDDIIEPGTTRDFVARGIEIGWGSRNYVARRNQ